MVKPTLKGLGMTNNEVEIYLALLNSAELSVSEIGTKSGLHRQVCYDALDRLLEKGFVSYVIKNNKKYFTALKPEKILDYLEEKRREINTVMPKLNELYVEKQGSTKVEVIKGKNVLRTIYRDIFNTIKETGETMLAMGVEETKFLEFDKIAIKQYIMKMNENNLKEKLLSKESAVSFFEGPQSEYKLLPDHLFNPNPTHIYGNKVAIIIWSKPAYGIITESKEVADANKKYFQILWSMAKKRKH